MMQAHRAREYAVLAHGDQTYGDNYPYVYHLDEVARLANAFLDIEDAVWFQNYGKDSVFLSDRITSVAYLHDVLEDTHIEFENLTHAFGWNIASDVLNVTDACGVNRKERKLLTWYKIRRTKIATYVKLCDRLANIQHSLQTKSPQLNMYKKEFPLFQAALYVPGEFEEIWQALKCD